MSFEEYQKRTLAKVQYRAVIMCRMLGRPMIDLRLPRRSRHPRAQETRKLVAGELWRYHREKLPWPQHLPPFAERIDLAAELKLIQDYVG